MRERKYFAIGEKGANFFRGRAKVEDWMTEQFFGESTERMKQIQESDKERRRIHERWAKERGEIERQKLVDFENKNPPYKNISLIEVDTISDLVGLRGISLVRTLDNRVQQVFVRTKGVYTPEEKGFYSVEMPIYTEGGKEIKWFKESIFSNKRPLKFHLQYYRLETLRRNNLIGGNGWSYYLDKDRKPLREMPSPVMGVDLGGNDIQEIFQFLLIKFPEWFNEK